MKKALCLFLLIGIQLAAQVANKDLSKELRGGSFDLKACKYYSGAICYVEKSLKHTSVRGYSKLSVTIRNQAKFGSTFYNLKLFTTCKDGKAIVNRQYVKMEWLEAGAEWKAESHCLSTQTEFFGLEFWRSPSKERGTRWMYHNIVDYSY